MSSGRARTFPITPMTKLPRMDCACSCAKWSICGFNTTWVKPYLSQRSTKINPPWSRRVCIHPQRVTCLSISLSVNSPQWCVLCSSLLIYDLYFYTRDFASRGVVRQNGQLTENRGYLQGVNRWNTGSIKTRHLECLFRPRYRLLLFPAVLRPVDRLRFALSPFPVVFYAVDSLWPSAVWS